MRGGSCNGTEFDEFCNFGWKIKRILDEYWGCENYSRLDPGEDTIPDMEYVDTPFLVFKKDFDQFDGGPKHARIKGKEKFRKKKEHQERDTGTDP